MRCSASSQLKFHILNIILRTSHLKLVLLLSPAGKPTKAWDGTVIFGYKSLNDRYIYQAFFFNINVPIQQLLVSLLCKSCQAFHINILISLSNSQILPMYLIPHILFWTLCLFPGQNDLT